MEREVTAEEEGGRLDVWLVARVPNMSRARAKKWTDEGWVRVNGRRARKGQRLEGGDRVSLEREPTPVDFDARPDPSLDLPVVFEDADVVVVSKPAGIPSHPLQAEELGTLANGLVALYPEMEGVGYRRREPGILHRLDTGTSGVLLAARNAAAFDQLRAELEAGRVEKHYLALCEGTVRAPQVLRAPIGHVPGNGRRMRVCEESGRDAQSELLSATPIPLGSAVTLRANRARRHQVRVHLADRGHPLLGDVLYEGPQVEGLERHALHASQVRVQHPNGTGWLDVSAPPPADLQRLLNDYSSPS